MIQGGDSKQFTIIRGWSRNNRQKEGSSVEQNEVSVLELNIMTD